MRKRRNLLIVTVCLVLPGTVVWLLWHQGEPVYRRHPLSYWASLYAAAHGPVHIFDGEITPARKNEAAEAIRQIGPRALPLLVRWVAYEPSRLRQKFWSFQLRLHDGPLRNLVPAPEYPSPIMLRRKGAMDALVLLGPSARAAVPELARLAASTSDDRRAGRLLYAMSGSPEGVAATIALMTNRTACCRVWAIIRTATLATNAHLAHPALLHNLKDPDAGIVTPSLYQLAATSPADLAVQTFTPLLQHQHPAVRKAAADALSNFGSASSPAVPLLLKCLDDPEDEVACEAAEMLGQLALSNSIVVPALTAHLQTTNADRRASIVSGLEDFGQAAQTAVPQLLRLLTDSDGDTRDQAIHALLKIAPEALTNAPPQ